MVSFWVSFLTFKIWLWPKKRFFKTSGEIVLINRFCWYLCPVFREKKNVHNEKIYANLLNTENCIHLYLKIDRKDFLKSAKRKNVSLRSAFLKDVFIDVPYSWPEPWTETSFLKQSCSMSIHSQVQNIYRVTRYITVLNPGLPDIQGYPQRMRLQRRLYWFF